MSTNGTRLTRGQGWVLALTSAASLMVSLDTQVVATALPVIRLHLHASLAALEWTVNAYTLTFAVLLLTGAALGERLGRRPMLAAGVGLFTAASAACALAPNAGAQSWEIKTCNGDGAVRSTPENVWPPNHKMHSVTLAYTESESDGDTVKLEVLSITNDEQGREKGKMLADNPDGSGVGQSATGVDLAPDTPYADMEVGPDPG